ncbi:MAG: hypothetical protein H5T66_04245 [Chloroflexi bacterium]|nr:hypothetical protein [Chloroflexota bacterium]
MRRASAWALMLTALFCTVAFSASAEPLRQQTLVQITSPQMGQEVRGIVPIMGSASVPDFWFYKVEWGFGPNPTSWSVIGEDPRKVHTQPVINGQLETWDTRPLPDGVYTLRLQGVKKDGNWEEFIVRQVVIANAKPTATPPPTATPTVAAPAVSPTPTGPTATPKPTATPRIIVPTAALSMPTPTPTLSRPLQRGALPVDPTSWRESFLLGGAAMGAVLVVLGIVFGLRRLL